MRKFVITGLAGSLLTASAALTLTAAQTTPSTTPNTQAGASGQSGASTMSDAQIRQKLEAQGYSVQSLKHEENYVEAKVTKGGQSGELRVDPQSGAITQTPEEGGDSDD
jgi:hypothetical protein